MHMGDDSQAGQRSKDMLSMVPGSSLIDADTVEREIITRLRAAKLRLRFDKAALRVVGRLKIALAGVVPEGET